MEGVAVINDVSGIPFGMRFRDLLSKRNSRVTAWKKSGYFLGVNKEHLIIVLAVWTFEVITHFGALAPDSELFFQASYYFRGAPLPDHPIGLVRPLTPLLSSILMLIFDVQLSYGILNSFFVLVAAIICYKLTYRLTQDYTTSVISSTTFLTSFTVIAYGSAAYYMGVAIALSFVTTFLAFDIYKSALHAAIIGVISGVSALSSESILIYVMFGFLYTMLFHKRYVNSILFMICSTAPLVISSIFLKYNYLDYYLNYNLGYAESLGLLDLKYWFNPFRRIALLAAGTSILNMIALVIGFLIDDKPDRIKIFYLKFSIAMLAWLSWVPSERRHVFILYPSIWWVSSLGIRWMACELNKKPYLGRLSTDMWITILLVSNAALNNILAYFWYLDGNLSGLGPIRGLSIPWFE